MQWQRKVQTSHHLQAETLTAPLLFLAEICYYNSAVGYSDEHIDFIG